jgi:transposase-like protein
MKWKGKSHWTIPNRLINNKEELSTFFEFPQEIRRLIYTTSSVEGYHSKSAL